MNRKERERIPTNIIVGFLGSGKTTAITKLVEKRPKGEKWSILINEFGVVSIDHALVDSSNDSISVKELPGGCACCTLANIFEPLLAQFIRQTKPNRLILEPSGLSHPANVVDILRNPNFSRALDLRNIICLIDPKDFDDERRRETDVFQDQIQLADIVVLNWTDNRDRDLIDRCHAWVKSFSPPKSLVLETSFGVIDSELLDREFDTVHPPIFADAHPIPVRSPSSDLSVLSSSLAPQTHVVGSESGAADGRSKPAPGHPIRFQNEDLSHNACGWIFHVDDVFDRRMLLDLLGHVRPVVRLKGVFRCEEEWWMINRAKDATSFGTSAYRRDSRLEIILGQENQCWSEFEGKLLECLFT